MLDEPLTREQVEHIAAQLAESTRVLSFPCSQVIAGWLLTDAALRAQLATVTAENERLTQLQEKNEGRVKAIVDEHLQQELARCRELLNKKYPNILKTVTTDWQTDIGDNQVPCHSRVIGGVLCRWWGDGPEPEGVAILAKTQQAREGKG